MTNTYHNAGSRGRLIAYLALALLFGGMGISLLTACEGRGIGLRTTFHEARFEIGKTTKEEVIGYLGLPQQIVKDPLGREHLFYDGSTRLISAMGVTEVVVAALVVSQIGQSTVGGLNTRSGAEYVFDENNILIAAFLPEK